MLSLARRKETTKVGLKKLTVPQQYGANLLPHWIKKGANNNLASVKLHFASPQGCIFSFFFEDRLESLDRLRALAPVKKLTYVLVFAICELEN